MCVQLYMWLQMQEGAEPGGAGRLARLQYCPKAAWDCTLAAVTQHSWGPQAFSPEALKAHPTVKVSCTPWDDPLCISSSPRPSLQGQPLHAAINIALCRWCLLQGKWLAASVTCGVGADYARFFRATSPSGQPQGPCCDPWYPYVVAQLRIQSWAMRAELGDVIATPSADSQLLPQSIVRWVCYLTVHVMWGVTRQFCKGQRCCM